MKSFVPVILFAIFALSAVGARAQSVNLALGQEATQSSNYGDAALADRAVDGNTGGAWGEYSLTHTNNDYQAWWQVDLGHVYELGELRVWNRTDCCADRLSDFYVIVSDQPFVSTELTATLFQPGVSAYHTQGQGGRPTTLTLNHTGRYVRVQLAGTNYLSLAEVEIFESGNKAGATPPRWRQNNVALAENGATAVASSTHSSGAFPESSAIDGLRAAPWNQGGYWNDNTETLPGQPYSTDTLEVRFAASTSIGEVNVFSAQDNEGSPNPDPDKSMTAGEYGLIDFRVEYSPALTGADWRALPDGVGVITGNNKVWRQIKFSSVIARRIRVVVTNARERWTRIAEVEAIRAEGGCIPLFMQEEELLRAIQNPGSENLYWYGYRSEAYPRWRKCLDPHFGNWPPNGSQNLPVVAAAIGLFRENNARMWNMNSPLTRSSVTYTQWWIDFLGYQSGAKELPTAEAQTKRKLRHFKGSELFSNMYDGPVVTSVVAARYWAARKLTGPPTPSAEIAQAAGSIRDYARKYLRANWYIYGLSAGNGPARQIAMPDPLFEYNPFAPLGKDGNPKYNGHFLAMAGSRSNDNHWIEGERPALFDRAIQFGRDAQGAEIDKFQIVSNEARYQRSLLNYMNGQWGALSLGAGSGANLYGLTRADRDGFKNLIKTGSFAFAGNSNYFSPGAWLANVHTFVTVRIVGWNENGKQVRLSTIQGNPNGNNPAVYAVMYREAGNKATFLYPFEDRKSAAAKHVSGNCTLYPTYVEAYQPEIKTDGGQVLHPEHWARISDIPTAGKLFHVVIAPHPAAAYVETKAQSQYPVTEPYNSWNGDAEAGDPSPPEN